MNNRTDTPAVEPLGPAFVPDFADPEKRKKLRQSYVELLRAFAHDSPPAAAATIVDSEYCQLDDVIVQFKLNVVSELVGIHADVGKPEPWQELEVCRQLLELQLHQGTPALWMLGRNAESGHVVLLSHLPIGDNSAADAANLRTMAQVCVHVAKGVRSYLFR